MTSIQQNSILENLVIRVKEYQIQAGTKKINYPNDLKALIKKANENGISWERLSLAIGVARSTLYGWCHSKPKSINFSIKEKNTKDVVTMKPQRLSFEPIREDKSKNLCADLAEVILCSGVKLSVPLSMLTQDFVLMLNAAKAV